MCCLSQRNSVSQKWAWLKAIGVAIRETTRNGKITHQVRYYILSHRMRAKEFAEASRGHWSIENQLQWRLDVTQSGRQMPGSSGTRGCELCHPLPPSIE